MKKFVFILGFLVVCSSVLASISINEPMAAYNLGDRLYIDLSGLRGAETGNLDINLVCGDVNINLVRIPARAFSASEDQTYSVPYKVLDRDDLGILNLNDIVGTCQVVASLSGDVVSGNTFEISNDIVVTASLDSLSYNPGQSVKVEIGATKLNGALVNGFVEGSNASSFSKAIQDGFVEEVFSVSDTAEAGFYTLNVRVYDVSSGGVLNEGSRLVSYEVNQVATSLVLSLSDVSVVPGENLSIGVEIFDQSGVGMDGNVFVKVTSPDGSEIESVVQAGDFAVIDFETNSSVGTWKIMSQFDDLGQEREFEMLPLQKVDFDFENAVLVVKNIGNVLYNKTINVNIGEEVMALDLKIGVGEIRKFSLKAPMGEYNVVVGDGEYEVVRDVLLTGNAISISDFKGVGIFKNYSIVWIFFIVVLGGIGGILIMKYRKTRTLGEKDGFFGRLARKIRGNGKGEELHRAGAQLRKKVGDNIPTSIRSRMDDSLNFTKKSPAVQGLDDNSYSHNDNTMVDFTRKGATSAESALVLKGEKHVSAIVALSVKNFERLGDVATNGLMEIVDNSKGKGLIDHRGDYIFVVFNPLVTRTYGNENLAVRCGMKILANLIAYNRKFRDKIEFGIGIHAGDLVASKNGASLKYTGIGNTISFAKRMSDVDSSKVVISEVVHKKLLRDLKVVKGKAIGEKLTYVVEEIRDRSGDAARLKQLISRGKNNSIS